MSEVAGGSIKTERITWVDVAKALGIVLVFYGHYVEQLVLAQNPSAHTQMNWIYSFHMPMFFLFVGLVYKRRELSTSDFLLRQIRTRLVPVWIFNVIGMLIWIPIGLSERSDLGDFTARWAVVWPKCQERMIDVFVYGRPGFNVLTWFLTCLFLVEVWQFLLKDHVRGISRLLVSIVIFGVLASLSSIFYDELEGPLGPRRVWWEFTPALMAMFFYQIGILCKETGILARKLSNLQRGILCLVFLAISLFSFGQNEGVDQSRIDVPLMIEGQYGQVWWFLISSFAGTGFIIYLSQLLSSSRFLIRLGTITLSLMLLDGIWHASINKPIVDWVVHQFPDQNVAAVTIQCVLGTVISLAISWPVALFLERYTPILIGRIPSKKRTPTEVSASAQAT